MVGLTKLWNRAAPQSWALSSRACCSRWYKTCRCVVEETPISDHCGIISVPSEYPEEVCYVLSGVAHGRPWLAVDFASSQLGSWWSSMSEGFKFGEDEWLNKNDRWTWKGGRVAFCLIMSETGRGCSVDVVARDASPQASHSTSTTKVHHGNRATRHRLQRCKSTILHKNHTTTLPWRNQQPFD